ncbi:hypothetical protein [Halocatena halophila]|uniref:hypothetical protein n=1 Tax=Halocatena halophila TaxID=2814576 RepID=UPI002ED56123
MTDETLLLIGCGRGNGRDVLETHAERLETQTETDRITTVTYDTEPEDELAATLSKVAGERVYVMVLEMARTPTTEHALIPQLAHIPGDVHLCRPPGRSAIVTNVIADVVRDCTPADESSPLVVVGRGSPSTPYSRAVTTYHANRLERRGPADDVHPCYLLEDPAVEAVTERLQCESAVAVGLWMADSPLRNDRLRSTLSGCHTEFTITRPIGKHSGITTAILAELCAQQTIGEATVTGVGPHPPAPARPSVGGPPPAGDQLVTESRSFAGRRGPRGE